MAGCCEPGRILCFSISPRWLCVNLGARIVADMWPHLPRTGRLLLGVACQHSRMPAKAGMWSSPGPAPGGGVVGWAQTGTPPLGTACIATWALPSSAGPGGSSTVPSVPPDLCSLPRVETLVPILQQVGSTVWSGHLSGHHVPSYLVGGPHRHRRHPLPPALRDLQEARCAVSGC